MLCVTIMSFIYKVILVWGSFDLNLFGFPIIHGSFFKQVGVDFLLYFYTLMYENVLAVSEKSCVLQQMLSQSLFSRVVNTLVLAQFGLPCVCPSDWINLWSSLVVRADTKVESQICSWQLKQIPSRFILHMCHILNCYWCLCFSIWHFVVFFGGRGGGLEVKNMGQSCEWWKWTRPTPRSWPLLQSLPHPAVVKASLFCSISWVCDYRPTLRALRVRLFESSCCAISPI